jgi:hypothetical protein
MAREVLQSAASLRSSYTLKFCDHRSSIPASPPRTLARLHVTAAASPNFQQRRLDYEALRSYTAFTTTPLVSL